MTKKRYMKLAMGRLGVDRNTAALYHMAVSYWNNFNKLNALGAVVNAFSPLQLKLKGDSVKITILACRPRGFTVEEAKAEWQRIYENLPSDLCEIMGIENG